MASSQPHILSTPSMLTRAEYLANGLTLVDATSTTEDCAICVESPIEPAKTQCNHIFCKSCLSKWLSLPGKNTCPACRAVLFIMPVEEPTNPVVERQAQVNYAVRRAGLAFDQPGEIEHFGITVETPSERWALQRAVPAATQYLVFSTDPQNVYNVGTAVVHYINVRAHIVAMGNIVPALFAASFETLTEQQKAEWKLVLTHLSHILAPRDCQRSSAGALSMMLRSSLRRSLAHKTHGGVDLCSPEAWLSGWLNVVMSYIVHICWQHRKDLEAAERAAQRIAASRAEAAKSKRLSRQNCRPM